MKRAIPMTIGTHSGSFQCDEALGVWLLRQLPEYADATLLRSRSLEALAPCDIVIDVGGVYDDAAKRYDHHQRGFCETFDGASGRFQTKLSACGLVYKHYGRRVLCALRPDLGADEARLDVVWRKLYGDLIEGVDAIDNGVEVADAPRYREGTHLSARVGRLNARWNAPALATSAERAADEDARFEKASVIAGVEFVEHVEGIVDSWLPARDLVAAALDKRFQVDESGRVLCFEQGGMPWMKHLYALERELGVVTDPAEAAPRLVPGASEILFVLYADQSGMWRVQAVTVEGTAFTNRRSLPDAWLGLRDAELSAVAKIPGCAFVHSAGFIGGHATRQGALQMALAAI